MSPLDKLPWEIAGFVVLAVTFDSVKAYPIPATHYLYLKRHEPHEGNDESERSLFIANVPVSTTQRHLKDIFTNQLDGGIIDRVEFSDQNSIKDANSKSQVRRVNRKRRRPTTDQLEGFLERYSLPSTWSSSYHSTGPTAVTVFVDRLSMENTLRAARRASKTGRSVAWENDLDERFPFQGLQRYKEHARRQYPLRNDMVTLVDGYMSSFNQMMELKPRGMTKKRQVVDEEGFVTVMTGSKGIARKQEAEEAAAKQRDKSRGLSDFYRFQTRERKKEQHHEMMKRFEQDKRRVEELKSRRGKVRVSWMIDSSK